METEIRQCMTVLAPGDGEFRFPASFIGFRGHFPGRPIVPGVCLLQAALVVAETSAPAPLVLREVVSAKFFAPVEPDAVLRISCTLENGLLKASLSGAPGRVAEIKLKVDHG